MRFDRFISPLVKRIRANVKLAMFVISAFVRASLGLTVILCADLGCLPEIRDTPDPTAWQPWESMAALAAHHDGSAYEQDKLTVHTAHTQHTVTAQAGIPLC